MNQFQCRYKTYGMTKPCSPMAMVCLATSKEAKMFEITHKDADVYRIFDKEKGQHLTEVETRAYVKKMIGDFIEEFKLNIDWSYVGNTFSFESNEEGRTIWDVYACVIVARWFVSKDAMYNSLVEAIYNLNKKYTMFESYIIAVASEGHDEYYNFSHTYAILDIDMYRQLVNKKSLISGCSGYGLNLSVSKILGCYGWRIRTKEETHEEYYFKALEECRKNSRVFIRVEKDKVKFPSYTKLEAKIKSNDFVHEWNWPFYYQSAISSILIGKLNKGVYIHGFGVLNILNYPTWFSFVKPEELIKEKIEEIKTYINKTGGLYRKPFVKNLNNIFEKMGIDMFEVINETKLLNKKLKPWKK